MTTPAQNRDEILAVMADWRAAFEAKDPAGLVRDYAEDAVLFDAIPSARTVGRDAIRAVWDACLPHFPERFRSEHAKIEIETDGDVAFVHCMHRIAPEPADHPAGSTWLRVTTGLRRTDGAWKVRHEHVSVPFDPMSGRAVMLADAEGTPVEGGAREKAVAQGMHSLTPHLVCHDARAALAFYERAFGARRLNVLEGPDGKIWNAAMTLNGSSIMLVDENPAMGIVGPKTLGGTASTLHLIVDDADAAFAKAYDAGATVVMPLMDAFWGDRYGVIEDPFGHRWSLAHPQRQVAPEHLKSAAEEAFAAAQGEACVASADQ